MLSAYPPIKSGGYLIERFTGPRIEARAYARQYLDRYPKAGYMTEVDSWKVLDEAEDLIEFTMRRLTSAD